MGTYGWWTLFQNPAKLTCNIISVYDDGEALMVEYDAQEADAFVRFTNKHSSSLASGDKRKLNIPFLDGRSIDDGWTNIEFTARVLKDGSRLLASENLHIQFLEDFAEGSAIAFYYGDTRIGSYQLRSSARAIAALRDCSKRLAGINPKDPFAQ